VPVGTVVFGLSLVFYLFEFAVDVPLCLFEVLDCVVFESSPPQILDGIAYAKVHVFSDLNALNATRMPCIMGRMIYGVICHNNQLYERPRL